ncbi:thiamine pyrophosphokinase [Kwoniella europaea PYCC6329]|uniref:Thiamine pyrophosphokinase n=1 Tax=Kwoniella europaea PYCC6329 TaxID=1423913 RepID=A0AAX4KBF5_9TREE
MTTTTTTWTCSELLRGESSKSYALIIVNQPIRSDLLEEAWKSAKITLCADGGANRYLPDIVKGDFDSIRDDVRLYYTSHDVRVIQDKDEYSTDLMKCIAEVPEDYALVLLGGLSGRVDQTVHTMSLLHKLHREIYVLDGESFAWLLRETCGILPVGIDSARVKTKGLKWDTENPLVTIETDRPVIWTCEIRSPL